LELLDEKIHLWISDVKYVKARPAIYILYDEKLDPIYVGESENLQETFVKYLETNFEDESCKQKTLTYQRTFTSDHKERKKTLLEKFKTEHGRLPECNSETD
jgi:excinuclease UvrABC nuclease subunit